jgi:hypothetical protein
MRANLLLALSITTLLSAPALAQPLRVASDAAHRWELSWNSVSVRDAVTSAPIREFRLEGAAQTLSRDFCPPDLVLMRQGTAYASSNIQPVLWRMNPAAASFELLQFDVDSHQLRDFGFTGLSASADGQTLYASASSDGALWHLDPSTLKARRIADRAIDADCSGNAVPR